MNSIFSPKVLPHIAALLVFLAISVFYWSPQLQGKKIYQDDIYQSRARTKEASEYYEKYKKQTLWTNSIFSGMPTYQTGGIAKNNGFRYIKKVLFLGIPRPIGYFFFGALSAYVLFLVLGLNSWLAIIGSLSFAYSTQYLLLFEVGHNAKIMAIFSAPLVIAGLYAIFSKRLMLGLFLYALGLGIQVDANHYQMTIYLGIFLGIYFIYEMFKLVRQKDKAILKIVGGLSLATLIAFGTSATRLLTTYEYAEQSIRGKRLVDAPEDQGYAKEEGLTWDYSTQFSNGFLDVLSTFIPKIVGGSSTEPVKANSSIVETFSRDLNLTFSGEARYYWGSMPFVIGPPYMGVVTIFLFLLALFLIKGSFKWIILSIVLISTILSMGKNFPGIYRFLFDYLPFFDKFRSPNSILAITNVFIPILAFMGVAQIYNSQDHSRTIKILQRTLIGFAVFCLFFAFLGSGMYDFEVEGDAGAYVRYGIQDSTVMLIEDRITLMRNSSLRTLLFAVMVSGALWFYMKGRLGKLPLTLIIGALILIDQVGVGKQYVNAEDFTETITADYEPRPNSSDEYIMKDDQLHFRVVDRTENPYASNRAAFFHRSAGGYHAAKLRRYDDVIERYLREGNRGIENMLNVKYYIQRAEDGEGTEPFINRRALGNGWISNSIKMVKSDEEELISMDDFSAFHTTLVHEEFASYVEGLNPTGQGTVKLTEYEPNELTYECNLPSEELVVFSEIWYEPRGWQAYINGNPVDHIRANYLLRALKVPEGRHEIKFVFEPRIFYLGENISLISSLLFFLFAATFGYRVYQNKGFANIALGSKKRPAVEGESETTLRRRKSSSTKKKVKSKGNKPAQKKSSTKKTTTTKQTNIKKSTKTKSAKGKKTTKRKPRK